MTRALALAISALLAIPALGQHVAAPQRSSEHSGTASHGFAPHQFTIQPGFRGPSSFSPPGRLPGTQPLPHRTLPAPGFVPRRSPLYSNFRSPDLRQRPPYQPGVRQNPDRRNRYRNRDRRRGDHRTHGGHPGWYDYGYPTWTYPYVWANSFTLSGWDDQPDYTSPDANGAPLDYAQEPPAYAELPYPDYNGGADPGPAPSGARPPYRTSAAPAPEPAKPTTPDAAPVSGEPLTLIFKDGRAPEKIQNYIMNGSRLTNLDPQHFEEIPLDEIDVAATAKLNRAHGVTFQVPDAPGQ